MYSREEGALAAGIQPCAALPTGCIMFDMEIFNVTDPKHEFEAMFKKYGDKRVALAMTRPWFYYEWRDFYQAEKISTEDVTASRDMVLCAYAKLGYNTMFCNWDAWAGHWKPKCVGKPVMLNSDDIHAKYAEAVLSGRKTDHKMRDMAELNRGRTAIGIAHPSVKVYNGQTALNDTIATPEK
jgi:hypothetical protein